MKSVGTGDFAEWHPRLPGEPRLFEEGDVVGFAPAPVLAPTGLTDDDDDDDDTTASASRGSSSYHITLSTEGAKQLGVISRRAIVQGSCPFPSAETFTSERASDGGRDRGRGRGSWDTVA
eukprot:COSAG06_NODE_40094_length_405_cov_1.483660_1_plen_119_part_01